MLGVIAAAVGGLVKDVVVGVENAYDYVVEEVSSIPEAFSTGYEHGIMSAPDEHEDPYSLPGKTLAELHG